MCIGFNRQLHCCIDLPKQRLEYRFSDHDLELIADLWKGSLTRVGKDRWGKWLSLPKTRQTFFRTFSGLIASLCRHNMKQSIYSRVPNQLSPPIFQQLLTTMPHWALTQTRTMYLNRYPSDYWMTQNPDLSGPWSWLRLSQWQLWSLAEAKSCHFEWGPAVTQRVRWRNNMERKKVETLCWIHHMNFWFQQTRWWSAGKLVKTHAEAELALKRTLVSLQIRASKPTPNKMRLEESLTHFNFFVILSVTTVKTVFKGFLPFFHTTFHKTVEKRREGGSIGEQGSQRRRKLWTCDCAPQRLVVMPKMWGCHLNYFFFKKAPFKELRIELIFLVHTASTCITYVYASRDL